MPDDLAPIGLQRALEEAEERRLAAAVAAQEANPLARLNRQIGLVQDPRAAEAQVDIGQRNEWHPWMIGIPGQIGNRRRCEVILRAV